MTSPSTFSSEDGLRIAASRAALGSTVTRWLVHELRGPVQVLTLIPELLESDGHSDASTLRMLHDGTAALERVALLFDEFLQRPPAEPVVAPVTVDALLQLMVRVGVAHRGDVQVLLDPIPAGLPAVAAVEGWLPHCLGVLLVNAIESCETERARTVRLAARADGSSVVLTVHDDGPGFPDAVAAAAFAGCSTRPFTGWPRGLGLPTARLVARAMGGDVEIAANFPGAVTVQLRLPAWPAPAR